MAMMVSSLVDWFIHELRIVIMKKTSLDYYSSNSYFSYWPSYIVVNHPRDFGLILKATVVLIGYPSLVTDDDAS